MAGDGLGVVVVGSGFGVLTHARALERAGFEVQGLVGRDPEKTTKRAARAGIPHAFTDLKEALKLPGVVAATVATPPHTHADIVRTIVEAGKHVVCEKPLARNAAEAREMVAAAEKAGVIHFVGTEFRWATGQAVAHRAIAEGRIGEPRLATFLLHVPMLADPTGEVPPWWSDASEGGGWLGAHASHVIDQIRVSLGDFAGVSASLPLLSDRDWTAEDTYSVHFRTVRGVTGVFQATCGEWGPPLISTRIGGSKGTILIAGDEVTLADKDGTRVLDVPEDLRNGPPEPPDGDLIETAYDVFHSMGIDLPPYIRLFETFRDRIEGKPPVEDPAAGTLADGLAVMEVLDAIRSSNAEHRWVAIER